VLPYSAASCPASPTRRAGCLATSPPLQASGASSPPFVGRADELALLQGHLAGVGPPLLVLEDESGIGKSRLLEEAGVCARDMGMRALDGCCRRGGGQEPYAPLPDILERHIYRQAPVRLRADFRGCAWLVRLLPALAEGLVDPLPDWTLTAGQEHRLIANALAHFLANVAGPAGTLVTLDDLQWATPDALDLLVTLALSVGVPPVRVLGAYRGTDAQPQDALSGVLADLARAGLVTHRTLGPLRPEETECLLDHLLEGVDGVAPSLRARVLQRAEGAPFFVVSWARGVRVQTWDGALAWSAPWDVRQSIRQRVAALPEAAREMLGVAAVVDRVVSCALLRGVVTRTEGEAVAALDAALRAHLLEEDGAEGYRFAHGVIREVVEDDLGAARRALLHRRVAETLERALGAPPVEALAYHYGQGGVRDKAALYAEQAGDRAWAQFAHAAAEGHYRDAADHLDAQDRPHDAAGVREKLGAVLRTMGRYDAALTVLAQAEEAYRAAGDGEGLRRIVAQIGRAHAARGTREEGLERLRPLLGDCAARAPSPGLAALYAALAYLLGVDGRYSDQLEAVAQAATHARAVGDDQLLAEAEGRRGLALTMMGRVEEGISALEQSIGLAEAVGDLDTLERALHNVACPYAQRGELDRARAYSARSRSLNGWVIRHRSSSS